MWTAFGIFLGTAFNVAVWNAGSINWRLMLGNYGPPNFPPKRVHQASDLETRCAPYPGNTSPPAYLLLPRVSTLVHEEEQIPSSLELHDIIAEQPDQGCAGYLLHQRAAIPRGRTHRPDLVFHPIFSAFYSSQSAPGKLGCFHSHVRGADVC